MPGTLKNYYEILGVPRSATADQIRIAYRKLLLKFHPDKNIGDTYFEEWSKKINEAFEVLMNPELRSEYDLVYDEARTASRQPQTVNKEPPNSAMPEEGCPTIDTSIQKLAPVYVSAKQAYIKAARNVTAIEDRLKVKRMNATGHFILGGAMTLAVLVWIAITNKGIWETSSLSAAPVIDQASILPLPTPPKTAKVILKNEAAGTPVDLWLKVVTTKAYFFETPDGGVLDDKFLSKGNKLKATKKAGDYYFCMFQSAVNSSYKIEGWIKMDDVEILAQ